MLKEERHNFILHEIKMHNKVHSTTLSKKLNVSEDTIRRDLKELSENGHIKKVHGGAMANPFMPANVKNPVIEDQAEKINIVQKGLDLIKPHQVLIVEGGATNAMLIENLPKDFEATIFTNSLLIGTKLVEYPYIESIFLGGRISKKEPSTIGLDVINYLNDIHVDMLLVETFSIHKDIGISDGDRENALTINAMMNTSRKVTVLCLSNAFGRVQPFKIAPIDKVDTIVTELSPDDENLEQFRNIGIQVI